MNRTQLKEFVDSSLLDGRAMDETLFNTLVNLAKMKVEMDRPWVKLRTENSSESISASNTWQTNHSLPTRFSQPYPVKRDNGLYTALLLVSGTETVPVEEIPWAKRLERQSTTGYFAIDYRNDRYILTGTIDRAYTAYLSYIEFSEDLDLVNPDDSWEWVFPSQFHPLLGYLVAAMEKARDYDEVNMANIQLYFPEAEAIKSAMVMWDTNLQRAMHNV